MLHELSHPSQKRQDLGSRAERDGEIKRQRQVRGEGSAQIEEIRLSEGRDRWREGGRGMQGEEGDERNK